MASAGLRIVYENPGAPVSIPEPYEGYDVESAFYDYLPSGAHALINVEDYSLDMTGTMLVDLVRNALPLAEALVALPPDASDRLRPDIPELPQGTRAYTIMFVDFLIYFPVLIFATDGVTVHIYTRTVDESAEGRLIVLPERDRKDPAVAPQQAVLAEISTFLTHYLNDVVAAFPFLESDDLYRKYRRRTDALTR